jgi:hypothetical protein
METKIILSVSWIVVMMIYFLVAGFFILLNLVGLPTYPSLYDKFLLVVSMVFNGVTIGYAGNWI